MSRRPRINALAGLDLDRRAERRGEHDWLRRRMADRRARHLLVAGGRILLQAAKDEIHALRTLSWDELAALQLEPEYHAFLGEDRQGHAWFALSVDDPQADALAERLGGRFRGLRSAAGLLDREQAGLAAYARALNLWQTRHRYCGACGSETRVDEGGFRRICTGKACGLEHFPRLDPAIIVLIAHQGRCLLGRQANWPPGRYSVLAGFVEPGESLEDAVVREVHEEAGVRLAGIRYHSSQPWPFPASLMVGFAAEAADDHITRGDELEDVRWFHPTELEREVRSGRVRLPTGFSVSSALLSDWLKTEHGIDMQDWLEGEARPW